MEANKNKRTKLIITTVVIALVAAIAAIIYITGSSGRDLKKQLDLGHKYLLEQNYEQAIACFKKVIEIDPMCEDAYLSMADAYVGIDDFDNAMSLLEEAIKLFEDNGLDATALKDKLAKIRAAKEHIEEEKAEETAEQEEKQFYAKMEGLKTEAFDVLWGSKGIYYADAYTWEQRKKICHPLIEKIIECIDYCEARNIDYIPNNTSEEAEKYNLEQMYADCGQIYLRCNEMEECYAIRKRQAERFGTPAIIEDGHSENHTNEDGTDSVWICDKYGRIMENHYTNEYGTQAHYVCTYYEGRLEATRECYMGDLCYLKISYEYDADGKLIGRVEGNTGIKSTEYSYVYSGNVLTVSSSIKYTEDSISTYEEVYNIDDYGYAVADEAEEDIW